MKYDVIVIGSGLGGLECAAILQQCGKSVLVLERQKQPGGCMQSYSRSGLKYDTGLHYIGGLGKGESLHNTFKYLGLLDLPWKRLDPDGFDRVSIAGRNFSFVQGYENFANALAKEFPHQKEALFTYVNMLRSCDEHQLDMLRPAPAISSRDGKIDVNNFDQGFGTGAWNYLSTLFSDNLLLNVLAGTSLKMDLDKDTIPLFTFSHGNSGFIQSSWRLCSDGNLLVDTLVKRVESAGGEVKCGVDVVQLVESNGKIVEAVSSEGERYSANIFISDAHPAVTCSLVEPSLLMKRIYKRRISSLANSRGMFTISLRVKPDTVKYFNFNQYIYRDSSVWNLENGPDGVNGILVSCRAERHNSNGSGNDKFEIDEFTQQIDILFPIRWEFFKEWEETKIGKRGDSYVEFKEILTNKAIDLAQSFIPGLRGFITEIHTSTPLTYRDYNLSPSGSAYGIKKDFNAPMLTVLSPRTPVPNLLMTGQSLMLHGVHGVTMTSLFTCAEILGKDVVWSIVSGEK